MNTRKVLASCAGLIAVVSMAACMPPTQTTTEPPAATEAPVATEAAQPASGDWLPVTADVCQAVKESAEQASGLTFTMVASAPLTISAEAGQACQLTASSTGAQISDPYAALDPLVKGMVGWEEDTSQQAGGPTGAATAMRRDMGILWISVGWDPAPEVQCPADQPISACDVKPEQQIYTVKIEAAMK